LVKSKESGDEEEQSSRVEEGLPHHERVPSYGTLLCAPVAANVNTHGREERKKKPPKVKANSRLIRLIPKRCRVRPVHIESSRAIVSGGAQPIKEYRNEILK
jgi:hypothetical protein